MERSLIRISPHLAALALATFTRTAIAEPATSTFGLIVANNRSESATVPDLQYADDDGARYHRLLRAAAGDGNVVLLTRFDRASQGMYPELANAAPRPPLLSELETAAARLGDAVRAAQKKGERTVFYFVYAGHGEMEEGRAFLDLEDGRIDGAFIEREIIERIPADTKHVVLDSCNSFFVINPRKPGGRRWATPKDMALGFSARHPEVGLFLSTNSDSEVFEWSDIESGVFSHEVRSGLTGAADVNRDGAVSYSELAGFVDRANRGIAREALRPHLFYRGPRGDSDAALFSTASMNGRRVVLDSAQTRFWLKSASGERLADVHKEPGPMTIAVPSGVERDFTVFVERKAIGESGRPTIVEHAVTNGVEPIRLAELAPRVPEAGGRGGRLFGALFEAPYGPNAYARYLEETAQAPEPVYGLTETDLVRMHHYLNAIAEEDRFARKASALSTFGLGAIVGSATVAIALDDDQRKKYPTAIITAGAVGAGLIGGGLYLALTPSTGEIALQNFQDELRASNGNSAQAFAKTEEWLTKMAAQERLKRNILFWSFEALGVGAAAMATAGLLADPEPGKRRDAVVPVLLYSEAALFIGVGAFLRLMETPTERMLQLYRDDPGLKLYRDSPGFKVHFSLAPSPSGATFGLFGTF